MSQTHSLPKLYKDYLTASDLAAYWSKKKSKLRDAITSIHEQTDLGSMSCQDGGPRSTLRYSTKAHVKKENMREFISWLKMIPEFAEQLQPTLNKSDVCEIIERCKATGIDYPDYVTDKETASLSVYREGWEVPKQDLPEDYLEVIKK